MQALFFLTFYQTNYFRLVFSTWAEKMLISDNKGHVDKPVDKLSWSISPQYGLLNRPTYRPVWVHRYIQSHPCIQPNVTVLLRLHPDQFKRLGLIRNELRFESAISFIIRSFAIIRSIWNWTTLIFEKNSWMKLFSWEIVIEIMTENQIKGKKYEVNRRKICHLNLISFGHRHFVTNNNVAF